MAARLVWAIVVITFVCDKSVGLKPQQLTYVKLMQKHHALTYLAALKGLVNSPSSPSHKPALVCFSLSDRCNFHTDPLHAHAQPVLRWILSSGEMQIGAGQSAFQVVVLSSTGDLVGDSGKMVGREQAWQYAGPQLRPRALYHWRVRVWDMLGSQQDWSENAVFQLAPSIWNASWITEVRSRHP